MRKAIEVRFRANELYSAKSNEFCEKKMESTLNLYFL